MTHLRQRASWWERPRSSCFYLGSFSYTGYDTHHSRRLEWGMETRRVGSLLAEGRVCAWGARSRAVEEGHSVCMLRKQGCPAA